MSGAEAGFVVGLIAGVISIIEATKTVYDAAKDAKGQPEEFRQVDARLPLVIKILYSAKERAQALDETAQEALEPILESCKVKAENLKKIFQKVIRKDDDKWCDRYKKAVGTLGKQGRVEGLMEGILKDIYILACEKLMGTATDAEVKEIKEAMKQMKDMASSLQDETRDALHQQHSGGGDNIGATGGSVLNLHKGTGDQHHNEIAGDAHFVNSRNSIFNIISHHSQQHLSDSLTHNCLQDLGTTDPREDKKRIEQTEGGLLKDSYRWILQHPDFQTWHDDKQRPLLWIKGDPGKGKTMLLCGIVNEMSREKDPASLLSYFFCQASDSRINNATAMLRGLIYLLVDQQPSLVSHVRKKYDHGVERPFEGVNGWVALSTVFENILQDPSLKSTYLIVDALDECETDLPQLLKLVVESTSTFPHVKWIVSSRNKPDIEARLRLNNAQIILSLELNPKHVSRALELFIDYKVSKLPLIIDDSALQETVRGQIYAKAGGTFLWAALVLKELESVESWDVPDVLQEMPPELEPLYDRMLRQVQQLQRKDPEFCRLVLSTMTLAYRPLHLLEVGALSGLPGQISTSLDNVMRVVNKCGSFFTIRENRTYFIHQSAKDFLVGKAFNRIFPSQIEDAHYIIFSRSLQVMSRILRRDVYSLGAPGFPINQVKQPDPDPLAAARYSCVYWIDHLLDCDPSKNANKDLHDGGSVDGFLCQKYLYWLEALSLLRSMPEGIASILRLKGLLQSGREKSQLIDRVRDAWRFILYHKWAIENSPLQVYASALIFSPARSIIRCCFKQEEPQWILRKPAIEDDWSASLQTLEGHNNQVWDVAFSPDGTMLASASLDQTIRLWDAKTGVLQQTLKGCNSSVYAIAFSPDGKTLASALEDSTIRLWDAKTAICQQTLRGHRRSVYDIAFSPDSAILASASEDDTVRLWDIKTGTLKQTLKGYSKSVWEGSRRCLLAVIFSLDGKILASASDDRTIRLWDAKTGIYQQTLEGHSDSVEAVAFSPDSTTLASASRDSTVRIWDIKLGTLQQTIKAHSDSVWAVTFSPDGTILASASSDQTIRLWDIKTGIYQQTLKGHSDFIWTITFSPDGSTLASASKDRTVRLWDIKIGVLQQKFEGHSSQVTIVTFSPDGTTLASASFDQTIRLWDVKTGVLQQVLEGYSSGIEAMTFSPDSTILALASHDLTIRLWDTKMGIFQQTLKGYTNHVLSLTFSPDGITLALALNCSDIWLWDMKTGTLQQSIKGHGRLIAFSPDGSTLASASRDRTVRLWDIKTGVLQQTFGVHSYTHAVAFSPDGMILASASTDRTVRLWDVKTGAHQQTLTVSQSIKHLSFSDDGQYLETERGSLRINSESNASKRCVNENRPDARVFINDNWITRDGKNFLWLHPDYRAICTAVHDRTLVFGHASGQVTFFELAFP